MADIEQLKRALVNADAAGDTEAAKALAAEIMKQSPASPAAQPKAPENKILGSARSFTEGLTLGWGDEIGMGIAALAAKASGADASLSEIYGDMRAEYDARQGQFKEENQGLATTMELAGGLSTGFAGGARTGAAMAGKSEAARLLSYAGAGASYGAVSGGGFAKPGETEKGAATGALIGAAAGPALPVIAAGATKIASPILNRLLGSASTKVRRQLERDIQNAGMSMDDAAEEMRKLGPNATLADLSDTLRSRAEMVSQMPGPGREMSKVFEARNEEAGKRISASIDGLFGSRVKLVDAVDDIVARTEQEASPLFNQAYQQFDNLPAVDEAGKVVNEGLAKLAKSGMVDDAIKMVNSRYESAGIERVISPSNMGLKDWHEVRKVLDDVAYGRIKESVMGKPIGDTAIARNLRARLTSELNTITKDPKTGKSLFEEANKVYSGQAQAMEAIEMGQKFWTKSPDLIKKELAGMSQSERDAYRLAALQKLYDKASDTTGGGSVYARLFNSPGKRDRIKAVLQDDKTFAEFEQLMKSEAVFGETYKATRTGSQTARRMLAADEAAIDPGIAVDVATGRPLSAAAGVFRNALGALSKPTEAERRELSRLLMQPGAGAQNALSQLAERPRGFYENPMLRGQLGGASAAISGEAAGQF